VADGRPEGPASLHDNGHVGWLCLVETHPAWQASEARPASSAGWLVGHRGPRRGRPTSSLLQLSDKHGEGEFTEENGERLRELAAFAGATLKALRTAKQG
jgi:hypothetical protein